MTISLCFLTYGNVMAFSDVISLSRSVYPPRLTPIAIGAVDPPFAAHKEGKKLC